MTEATSSRMDRRTAVPKLIGNHEDFLIIAGLGGPAKDIGELAREAPNTFLFGGAMAGATSAALGLALAKPDRRVLVATGDGDLLMSLGSLATIGALKPQNLAIVCIDNERYGETGNQVTHTHFGIDLRKIAEDCGIPATRQVEDEAQLTEASGFLRSSNGPVFVLLKVSDGPPPSYNRNWHAQETKTAFRYALLGKR